MPNGKTLMPNISTLISFIFITSWNTTEPPSFITIIHLTGQLINHKIGFVITETKEYVHSRSADFY